MRLSLRDPQGHETGACHVDDAQAAPEQAMMLLVCRKELAVGEALLVEDDLAPIPGPISLTANKVAALAARLEHRAYLVEQDQPEAAADDRLAARLCRHALKAGWVYTAVELT
jgi:hypothetical protein